MSVAAGTGNARKASPVHFLSIFLSKNVFHIFQTSHIHSKPAEVQRDSGSSGFLISSSVVEAAPEGQSQILPNEGAIVDPCLHFCASPFLFTKEASFFLCAARGLMRLLEHTCALRKIPLLSVKLYYLAQGHDSQCFSKLLKHCIGGRCKLSATQ